VVRAQPAARPTVAGVALLVVVALAALVLIVLAAVRNRSR